MRHRDRPARVDEAAGAGVRGLPGARRAGRRSMPAPGAAAREPHG